jgi:molybdopterin-guanine dinucleotide biosynthesis protein A
MTRPQVSVIVLAGGRSRRFGRDKLREAFAGRTLLEHAIAAVAPVADETIVVAAPDEQRNVADGIVLVHDTTSFEGPLAGILTGLGRASHPVTLVVGGDMPTMVPAVLGALIDGLQDPTVDAVVLEDGGERRPLPVALRSVPARSASGRLIAAGERRLGALMDTLATAVIDEAAWRVLDPDGRTLRDIDTPGDLP